MELLLFGGTAFLGRAIACAALDRGIRVTCACRGSAPLPEGAEHLAVDRQGDTALKPLADRRFDVVIDLTSQPGQARRALRDIAAAHWMYVSSINVYADFDTPDQAEDAPLREPLPGEDLTDMELYGEAKVACENAVREAAARWTIIRPGLIGGPGDRSGRSGYYPWRFAHPTGPDVLVPDAPNAGVHLIDVRDLAAWIVTCAEAGTTGVFNAGGPATTLERVLADSHRAAHSAAVVRPVDPTVLARQRVASWAGPHSLPLWIDEPGYEHFGSVDSSAARAAGLRSRPLHETLADVLAWEEGRGRHEGAGLTDDQERQLRASL